MYFTLNFLAHYRLGMLNVTNLLMCDGLLSWSWALDIMCVFKVTGHQCAVGMSRVFFV